MSAKFRLIESISFFKASDSTGGNTSFSGYEKLLEESALRLYSEPKSSLRQADNPSTVSNDTQKPSSETIADLFFRLIDTTLAVNNNYNLEVYKHLIDLLQKRLIENTQDTTTSAKILVDENNYYERHETPEIANEFINRLKSAPIIPSSYSVYTDEEIDLF